MDVDVGRRGAPGGTVGADEDEEEKKVEGRAPGVTVGVVRGFMRGGSLGEPALALPRATATVLEESCRSTSRMGVATPQF